MAKLYAPYIENILPAFLWNNKEIVIAVPFEHHQLVGSSDHIGYALQIKDALYEDDIANTIVLRQPYDANVQYDNLILFTLSSTHEHWDKIKIGRHYKIALAYLDADDNNALGYWSTTGIAKCTYLGTPEITISKNFKTIFTFPYTDIDEEKSKYIDQSEKLYSVAFTLYNSDGKLLEKTDDIIVNYQVQTPGAATVVEYQFNTYFQNPTFEELVAQQNFIYEEIMDAGTEHLFVIEDADGYKVQDIHGGWTVVVEEFDDSGEYTSEFLQVAKKIYTLYPEWWSPAYTVKAQYQTINKYTNTIIKTDAGFSMAHSNSELLITAALDYNNALIQIDFADATPGNVSAEQADALYIYGNALGQNSIDDLIDKCSDFSLIRKNLVTDQCIRLFHANSLVDFYYKTTGFQDLGIEQGITYEYILTYKYTVAQTVSDPDTHLPVTQMFSTYLFTKTAPIMADFEDCFLYDATSQLRLRFNPKITSYKITTPQAKQNTIGGRFPFIFENRAIRYKEFPLSFLISYLCDQDSYFINGLADKYAYLQSILQKGNKEQHMSRYVAQQQTGANVTWDGIPNNTLTSQNIFLERQFKMAVLDWLTNGEPKIFKSPIEGNMVVKLINVSLTPEDKLGRMLHTCASTAVEVEEYTDKYLQKNNLLLYQAKSNKTFDMPFVPNNAILLQTITLSNGSDAYVYTLTNKQLIQQKRSGYYLTGRIIREGEDRN